MFYCVGRETEKFTLVRAKVLSQEVHKACGSSVSVSTSPEGRLYNLGNERDRKWWYQRSKHYFSMLRFAAPRQDWILLLVCFSSFIELRMNFSVDHLSLWNLRKSTGLRISLLYRRQVVSVLVYLAQSYFSKLWGNDFEQLFWTTTRTS